MDLFGKLFESTGSWPWMTVARHTSALLLYGIAFAQWPSGSALIEEDFNTSTTTFTLTFWSACFYHYVVSAGRVTIDWERYRFKAKGWVVKSSRRMHRAILVVAMAVCSATVIQPATVYSVHAAKLRPSQASLLKTDFLLALMLATYVGIRLCLEPTGLIKRRRRRRQAHDDVEMADPLERGATEMEAESAQPPPLVLPNYSKHPSDPEECSICVERIANRQTNCGHRMCSGCLREMTETAEPETGVKCPFCRRLITSAKRLLVIAESDTVPLNQDSDGEADEPAPRRPKSVAVAV